MSDASEALRAEKMTFLAAYDSVQILIATGRDYPVSGDALRVLERANPYQRRRRRKKLNVLLRSSSWGAHLSPRRSQ